MKTTIALAILLMTSVALAKDIAVCTSGETILTVYRDNFSTDTWESISLRWNRSTGHTSVRQFVNNEIEQNDAKKLVLSQNNRFLGMGNKTTFTLDKNKRTATLKGKVGGQGITFGDGPHHLGDTQGKFNMKFTCELN